MFSFNFFMWSEFYANVISNLGSSNWSEGCVHRWQLLSVFFHQSFLLMHELAFNFNWTTIWIFHVQPFGLWPKCDCTRKAYGTMVWIPHASMHFDSICICGNENSKQQQQIAYSVTFYYRQNDYDVELVFDDVRIGWPERNRTLARVDAHNNEFGLHIEIGRAKTVMQLPVFTKRYFMFIITLYSIESLVQLMLCTYFSFFCLLDVVGISNAMVRIKNALTIWSAVKFE